MIRIEFETDNAAFDGQGAAEASRLLYNMSLAILEGRWREGDDPRAIQDINGNRIGTATWEGSK